MVLIFFNLAFPKSHGTQTHFHITNILNNSGYSWNTVLETVT